MYMSYGQFTGMHLNTRPYLGKKVITRAIFRQSSAGTSSNQRQQKRDISPGTKKLHQATRLELKRVSKEAREDSVLQLAEKFYGTCDRDFEEAYQVTTPPSSCPSYGSFLHHSFASALAFGIGTCCPLSHSVAFVSPHLSGGEYAEIRLPTMPWAPLIHYRPPSHPLITPCSSLLILRIRPRRNSRQQRTSGLQ
jgi:hypothetical protein